MADRRPPEHLSAAPLDPAADAPQPAHTGGDATRPERRRGRQRRSGRAGLGRRQGDQEAQPPGTASPERRRSRTLHEQRQQWSAVRRWVAQHDLEPFRQLLERLAQVAFGPAATVMPHLRRSRGRQYLVFVVDAACPEASSNYAGFLPLEQAFWTAYATIPKPSSAFIVAVRPARGWCRAEALMPMYTQLSPPDLLT